MSAGPSKAQLQADLTCLSQDLERVSMGVLLLGGVGPLQLAACLTASAAIAKEGAKMVGEMTL